MKQSRVDLGISARNHVAAHESQGCGSLAAKGPSDRKSGAKVMAVAGRRMNLEIRRRGFKESIGLLVRLLLVSRSI